MWFWFSLIALICWSGSDLFSKIGCQDADDKYSHLKMVMAVGLVMGLHAAYEIFINGTEINGSIILTYLPVSLLYISSMTIGYIGLRYIELSISSPICNSSGALVAVLALATGGLGELVPAQLMATALVCVGVIGLGIVEAREDDDLRAAPGQGAAGHQTRCAAADNEALHSTSPNSEMSFSPASSVTACSAREQVVYSRRRSSSVRAHSGHTAITPSNSMPFIM